MTRSETEPRDQSRAGAEGKGLEDIRDGSGGGESTLTVMVAFFANLGVAVAKTLVAVVTGSASMLAEAAHSWADTGNQVFLFVADRKARRPPDATHPFGYGREAYVWSMFAALGLFTAGGAVSVWHGVSQLLEGGSGEEVSYTGAYIVLGVALLFEGTSFAQAYRQTRREARAYDREIVEHALLTSDPTLRAVFAEDSAAIIGILVAAGGVFLHQVTGSVVWDALGSVVVGLLLIVVAVVLIQRNRVFLTGAESDSRLRAAALATVKRLPEVARVCYLRLEFVGPGQVLLVASVDLEGDLRESTVATVLRDLELRLEQDQHVTEAVLTPAAPDEVAL